MAVGRYSEDVFYNGNPWYLANFAVAEQLYDALYVWKKQGSITVTSVSLAFFKELVSSAATGTYASGSTTYQAIISAVSAYADGFVDFAASHVPSSGALSEQFDRNSGTPLSAADLTWSYAAFLSAADRRAGIVPAGWSAASGNTLPTTCSRIEVAGTYSQAPTPVFPASQTANPTASTAPSPFPTTCLKAAEVYVTFNEKVTTVVGQTIKVVGSSAELGSWNVASAVTLSAVSYTASNPLWSITVPMTAGQTVTYKYIRVNSDGSVTWESDPNRSLTVSASGACTAQKVDDSWR